MKTRLAVCLVVLPFLLPALPLLAAEPGKWPFKSETQLEAVLTVLKWKLYSEAGFSSLPKGVTLGLDVGDEPEPDGWYQVTLREFHSEDSGFDPNVAPALAHFYVREGDGAIQWYDLVEDKRRPWEAFLKDRSEP